MAIDSQHMIVVHGHKMIIVVEADGLCTWGMAMTTGNIVSNDIELRVLNQIVTTNTHKIVAHAVESEVVGISRCSTGPSTAFRSALPFPRFARAARRDDNEILMWHHNVE